MVISLTNLFSKLIKPGVELLRIDNDVNGFDDLMNKLGNYEGLNAIHLFAHNQNGQMLLGNQLVAESSIQKVIQSYSQYNQTIAEGGELLIYNTQLENNERTSDNLEILKGEKAKPIVSKPTFNADELEINKGDINAYPEEGSIARNSIPFVATVYDFNNATGTISGGSGSTTVKQDISGNVLQVTAAYGNVYVTGASQYGMSGFLYSGYNTTLTISLESGDSFDLESFDFSSFEAGPGISRKVYVASGGTTYTKTITGNSNATSFNISSSGQAASFQGITSFTISGDLNDGGRYPSVTAAIDNVQINNISSSNSAASFDEGATTILNTSEDAGSISINSILDITDSDSGDPLTWSVNSSPSNGSLGGFPGSGTSNGSRVEPTGLTYTPNSNFNGSDSFTIQISDGSDTDLLTVTVNVSAVNDIPSFTIGSNQTVSQSAGAQTISGHTSGMSDNDGDTQALAFNVSNDNYGIFDIQPDINEATGDLTFTPKASAYGKATVTVNLSDDGGGSDTSGDQAFDIFVTPDGITINEIHPSGSSSTSEFVEIYNSNAGSVDLTDLVLVLFNGSDDQAYKDISPSTGSIGANDFYVIGDASVTNLDLSWGSTALQNGPDAVALYVGSVSDFTASSSPITDGLVDVIVYGSSDDSALRVALGNPSLVSGNGDVDNSLSRNLDGTGAFIEQMATPGTSNNSPGTVSSNTAPTAVVNTGSSLSEGDTYIVSSSELEFDDAEEPDTDITYTLDDLPDNGTLRKNTVALTLGGTFTQDDINNNRIDYVHDGKETTSDSFRVDVSDGQGGTVDDQTFNFTITPVDDAPIAGSGTALDFDGANEFVELNSTTFGNFGTNPFTIEGWVKVPNASIRRRIMGKRATSAATAPLYNVFVQASSGLLAFEIKESGSTNNGDVTGTTNIADNEWHHFAVTRSGTTTSLYVDGVLEAQKIATTNGGGITNVSNSTSFKLGKGFLSSDSFLGQLDEVRIWNEARSLTEIQNNRYKILLGNETNLEALFRLDENGGTMVYDATGNNNDGTLTNMDAGSDWVESEAWNKRSISSSQTLVLNPEGYDVDGALEASTQSVAPSNGTLTFGSVIYTPSNFGGTDNFTYQVNSGGKSDTYNITVTVTDDTAPSFESSTPSYYSSVTQTGFTLTTDIDEAGDIFYVVLADGAVAPISSDVVNGTGNGGAAAVTSDNASVTTGGFINSFSVTGLTAGTDYDVYVVARDDEGSPNLQGSPTKLDVTTAGLISLTITGLTGSDKVYDDTTAGSALGTATLVGVEAGDDVFLGGSPVFTFASANVGMGITINTSGYTINGADAGKYTLTQPTLSGDITGKELTITGITGDNKVYDGTTAATVSGTATLSGIIGADDVFLGGSPVFTFASANVGTGITINTSGYTISGTESGNYTLTQPTLSGDITGKELTITGITGDNKVYDGTTAATGNGTATLSGIIGADDVFLGGSPVFTFASANVGTGITINTSGYTIWS